MAVRRPDSGQFNRARAAGGLLLLGLVVLLYVLDALPGDFEVDSIQLGLLLGTSMLLLGVEGGKVLLGVRPQERHDDD